MHVRMHWSATPLMGLIDNCPRLRPDVVARLGDHPMEVVSLGGTQGSELGMSCKGAEFRLALVGKTLEQLSTQHQAQIVISDPSRRIEFTLHDVWNQRHVTARAGLFAKPGDELVFDWSRGSDIIADAESRFGKSLADPAQIPNRNTFLFNGADYVVERNYGGLTIGDSGELRVRIPDDAPIGPLQICFQALSFEIRLTPPTDGPNCGFMNNTTQWLLPDSVTVDIHE
ncbi:MAG: hypothetical protein ACI8RZ_006493 [Myxococcota bacterium]|jgi:hypothetical protein